MLNKIIWDKVFKNGPSKICGRQPLKKFTWSVFEYFISFYHRTLIPKIENVLTFVRDRFIMT